MASAPAHPDDRPVSDWIRSSTGPMLAAAGRRLMETRITPTTSSAGESGGRARRGAFTLPNLAGASLSGQMRTPAAVVIRPLNRKAVWRSEDSRSNRSSAETASRGMITSYQRRAALAAV